jgi:hypothetical protein
VPRTIIYDRPIHANEATGAPAEVYSGGVGRRPRDDERIVARPGDDFASKLMKYIPAEALALVALISSIRGIADAQVLAVVIVGGVGQMLWLMRQGKKLALADHPSWRQYSFALIAYVAWVLGTSPTVCGVLGVSPTTGTIAMASVAYLLPLIDDSAHDWLDPKPSEPILTR